MTACKALGATPLPLTLSLLTLVASLAGCSSGTTSAIASDAGTPTTGDDASSPTPSDDGGGSGGSTLTGKLGKLGAVKPVVSSLFIANSGETLVYLSTGPITCDQLTASRWLGGTTAGSQVVEIVIKGTPTIGTVAVPPGEVNYAEGGKSSSYEVNAASGSITFTAFTAKTIVAGTVKATYDDGSAITGSFHATYCDGGQDY